jgi:DNA primase
MSSSTVQQIKERLSIVDVISSYIDIEKSGANFKAKCPFHHEKTASFYISPDRGSYYCFGCAVKGDIFTFVQEFEGVDFVTALKMLADKSGVVIEKYDKSDKSATNSNRAYEIMEDATKFFQNNLKNNTEALLYIKKRSLSIESLRVWRLGFAQEGWRTLKDNLTSLGYTTTEMLDAGLIKQNEKGESYDRFRGRVMFPIFDTAGRVIAFSGRILVPKDEEPKYLNSPDTSLFDKSKTLYGYNIAKSEIRLRQSAILVEGQMDLLMSHQAGLSNTVASSGTAFTSSHVEMLKRLTNTIIIAYDADNAGRSATLRAWKLALAGGLDAKIVFLPQGLDPADAVAKDPEIWKSAVGNAQNIIDYFIKSMKDEGDTVNADKILKEKILPLIKYVNSAIDRSRFLQKLSFESGIPESALIEEMSSIKDDELQAGEISPPQKIQNTKIPEAISYYIYLVSKNDEFANTYKGLLEGIDKNFETIIPDKEEDKSRLLFEIEMHYGEEKDKIALSNKLLHHFEEDVLKTAFTSTMERIKKAESIHDIKMIEEELRKCQDISLKLSELNKKYLHT